MIKTINKEFVKEVLQGLKAKQKSLPSKYFYDQKGDKIFQEIMRMDEYYPTNSEFEILSLHKEEILKKIKEVFGEREFSLIEFGAGDGFKTKLILEHLINSEVNFQYRPVDISEAVLKELQLDLTDKMPKLDCKPLVGTYTKSLKELKGDQPKLLFFLGSNLGNFTKKGAKAFIKKIFKRLQSDDMVLFGIDLKKDPRTILEAYNDPKGITKAFNLNLLERINRELGGNFVIDDFDHFPIYDPQSGICKSYLISKKDQKVSLDALDKEFDFAYAEAIQTEVSIKYSPDEVEDLFHSNGFKKLEHFFDCKHYFLDTLWKKP